MKALVEAAPKARVGPASFVGVDLYRQVRGLQGSVDGPGQVIADRVQVDRVFSLAANVTMVWSASYLARLKRRSTARCVRRLSGLNNAAAASVDAATAI